MYISEYNPQEISNRPSMTTIKPHRDGLICILCLSVLIAALNTEMTAGVTDVRAVYNVSYLLDKLLEDYDNRLRPGFGGLPTVVDVNLNIRSMGPISEADMAYQMDCYFRQSWVDKRLEFSGNDTPEVIPVSITILDRIWKPDTHFFNGMKSYLHLVTSPNKLLRINQDGRILYSMRLTIKASCPMHLETFPMDIQTCPLKFGSHGYSMSDIIYKWKHGSPLSIKMAPDMTLSQFDLIGFPQGNESKYQPNIGTFSILYANFALRRHMGYFLINVYVPCSLLVILSWVAFWINREATSDRIALGITTVLTMCFMNIDNRRDIPKVSYSTALDYFVAVCFTFVLATIIQFAGVHFFTKHGSGEVQHDPDSEESDDEDGDAIVRQNVYSTDRVHNQSASSIRGRPDGKENGDTGPRMSRQEQTTTYVRRREHCCLKFWNCFRGSSSYRLRQRKNSRFKSFNSVSKIDRVSRVLFPFTFISFNIFYWSIYLQSNISSMVM